MPRLPAVRLIVSALLLSSPLVRGDGLVTLDGRVLEGTARFEGDSVHFSPRTGPSVKLPLNEVLHLTIGNQPAPRLSQGIILADGSRVRVRDFVSSDGRTLRFRSGDGEERALSLGSVAVIVFGERGPPTPLPAESGAVLLTGDFFAGELLSIKDNQLTVSSVLFGIRRFRLGQEVQSFWIRAPGKLDGHLLLVLSDGSCLDASNAVLREGKLQLEHPVAGRLALQAKDVREVRVAGPRVVALSSLRLSEQPPPSLVPTLRMQSSGDGLKVFQRSGSSASFDLPVNARTFVAEIGPPPGSLPVAGLRFMLLVDGRQVARSELLTSLDPPQQLAASVHGARRLTLVIESQPSLELPLFGAWIDPAIVRD
jgi:hypothetical protein